jgi:hypothetical protein
VQPAKPKAANPAAKAAIGTRHRRTFTSTPPFDSHRDLAVIIARVGDVESVG